MFVSFYVATLFALWLLHSPLQHLNFLVAVVVANVATIRIFEHGRWPLGLFVAPRLALRDFIEGSLWGIAIVGACALAVVLLTGVRHERGSGFPWLELAAVFVPAVFHEELFFRGYPYQKLRTRSRGLALLLLAIVFAALHANNTAVTPLALFNIFLGGILLGLAYERYERLWLPIGLHLAWNLMSGPILGHEVSGHDVVMSVFVERGWGPELLTGGEFGIEGSVLMTAAELVGIAIFWKRLTKNERSYYFRARIESREKGA